MLPRIQLFGRQSEQRLVYLQPPARRPTFDIVSIQLRYGSALHPCRMTWH